MHSCFQIPLYLGSCHLSCEDPGKGTHTHTRIHTKEHAKYGITDMGQLMLQSLSGQLLYYVDRVETIDPVNGNQIDNNYFTVSSTSGEIILARDLKQVNAPNRVRVSTLG